MKHKYWYFSRVCLVLFMFGIAGYSYAQKTEWAMGIGGKSTVSGKLVTTGPSGDIYVAGAFKDTIDADPGPSESFLYSAGGYDIYILKLKSYGMLEWAYRLGGASDDHVKGLDVDQNGNIYLTGYFQGTSDFEPGAGTYVLNSGTGSDIFVLKLNQAVVLQWAVNMGGESSAYANDIVVDETGESYLTGFFYDTVDFDPGVNSEKHGSIGNGDIFVLNLDANGVFDWVKTFGGVGHDQGIAITLDTNSTYGYSLVTGCFSDSVAFPMNAQSAGESDVFISKLGNLTGQYIWHKTMGSVGNDRGKSIQADKDGNVYTTGYYSDNIDIN